MNFYLDAEFNGFHGELISLALVGDGAEWYEVLELPLAIHPWVRERVIPVLGKEPLDIVDFTESLHAFLGRFRDARVYADWPEDFAHLCNMLVKPGGWQLNFWPTMCLIESGKLFPVIPHNALEDARALMRWHYATIRNSVAA